MTNKEAGAIAKVLSTFAPTASNTIEEREDNEHYEFLVTYMSRALNKLIPNFDKAEFIKVCSKEDTIKELTKFYEYGYNTSNKLVYYHELKIGDKIYLTIGEEDEVRGIIGEVAKIKGQEVTFKILV